MSKATRKAANEKARGFSRRNVLIGGAAIAGAQVASAASAQSFIKLSTASLAPRLEALEAAVEAVRQKLGIPGMALAIVKDNHIVFQKGFGVRDVASQAPVTTDTRFAIGSISKSFTAFAAVMSADEGLLSLDESPKRLIPYFGLADADADAKVTIRDLLAHTTGVMRSDIAWISGILSREELVRLGGIAKPTAKLRQAFQYQNGMYVAAGEAIAAAHATTWERLIERRLFAPLGMKASAASIEAMRKSDDFATGHDRVSGEWRASKQINRHNIAAAGGISSTAGDMAEWVRFLLNGGAIRAGRLISQAGFQQMTHPHIRIGATELYGLGLFLGKRGDRPVVHHGGNIDGFEAHMFMLPLERLGFILLTNVGRSALPAAVEAAVLEHLVGNAQAPSTAAVAASDPAAEVGRYVGPGFSAEVVLQESKLAVRFFNQPEYPLELVGGRRYRFGEPAPAGFFVTFREDAAGGTECFLEQPQGSAVMTRLKAAQIGLSAIERDLLGTYQLGNMRVEIEAKGDFAVLMIPGQHPYTLVAEEGETFRLAELPPAYRITLARNADRVLTGIVFKQPEGEFAALRIAGPMALDLTVDEIMAKAIAAVGGEAQLRKHRSLLVTTETKFENLGLTATSLTTATLPQSKKSAIKLIAFGKEVGSIDVTCEGASRETISSFSEPDKSGACVSDVDYVTLLNWKSYWNSVTAERKTMLDGETVYVVRKAGRELNEIDYYAASSFRLVQRDTESKVEEAMRLMATESFKDYRAFDGVMVPMRSEGRHMILGRALTQVTAVRFDGASA